MRSSPDGPMIDAIHAVAAARGVSSSWMNNQASVYFSPLAQPGKTVFEHPSLRVMVTRPDHLAAMKILASRAARDRDDLLLLIEYLGWTCKTELLSAVNRYFPHEVLGTRQRSMLDSLGLTP